jgi:lipoprotein-anchoring transpeptidase ErfK/SrfK
MSARIVAQFAALFRILLIAVAIAFIPWPAEARQIVSFEGHSPGTIVIRTSERRLYYVLEPGRAIRYSVGVGKAGMQWSGRSSITGKHIRPDWVPPDDIRRANPRLPRVVPAGSSGNPLGAAALTLHADYAIHGTNRPQSIGRFVSHGCIRMHNRDVLDLFKRVSIGTPVVVTR